MQSAQYDGQTVTITDTETHRDKTMHYIESESGLTRWVFDTDLDTQ